MATAPIVWIDSFASQDPSIYAAHGGTYAVGGGRGGRNAYIVNGNSLSITLPAHTLWIANFAVDYDSTTSVNDNLPTIGGLKFFVQNDRTLAVNVGGTIYGTSAILPLSSYLHIAVRVFRSTSAGTIDIWFNNASVLSVSGLNTGGGGTTVVNIQGGSALTSMRISDLIVQASDTATDEPVGDLAVTNLMPIGAGTHTDFGVTGAAANWAAVDESPPDGDTSFVASNTVGAKDSYAMADLPSSVAAVIAVAPKYAVRKTDAGTRTWAPLLRIGGTDYVGTTQTPGTSYAQAFQVYETNPHTGAAWTVADVNALEVGEEVVS